MIYLIWLDWHSRSCLCNDWNWLGQDIVVWLQVMWSQSMTLWMAEGEVQPLIQDFHITWMILHWYRFHCLQSPYNLIFNFSERVKGSTFSPFILFSWLGGNTSNNRQVSWWCLINSIEINNITCRFFISFSIFSLKDVQIRVWFRSFGGCSINYDNPDETRVTDS